MAYLGNTVQNQGFIPAIDTFSGNGSTTAFTLSRPVASVAQVEAVISNVVQDPNTAYTVSGNTITFTSAPPSGTNNIYVRYTSLITQVIAPSQGTVGNTQFANNVSAIPMPYGTIGAGNASIMKNRIINGAMVIDQRNAGASVTNGAGTYYFIDRFNTYDGSGGSHFSLGQNLGGVTPPTGYQTYMGVKTTSAVSASAGNNFSLNQYIEGFNINDLNWGTANAQTVTISFWVQSSLTGTFCGVLQSDNSNAFYVYNYTISSANTWTYVTATIPGPTIGTWNTNTNGRGINVRWDLGYGSSFAGTANTWSASAVLTTTGAQKVVGTLNATFYITGVQLEVGSSATGFEYVNYQTSLANCQRYYYQFIGPASGTNYIGIASGLMLNTTIARTTLIHKVPMRTSPTITPSASTTIQVQAGTASATLNSITAYTGSESALIDWTINGSSTAGQGAAVFCISNTQFLTVSAEL